MKKEQLKKELARISKLICDIDDFERQNLCRTIKKQRYYKTRNNYSCPSKPRDYWWLYIRVDGIEHGYVKITSFQRDKEGDLFITHDKHRNPNNFDHYVPITSKEFKASARRMIGFIQTSIGPVK